MSFDINMNMSGLLPATGGGGQFPATSLDGSDGPMFHRCAIKSGERKVNTKNSGEVVQLILEGRSKEVVGMTHKVTINIAHSDPETAKRGAQDMLAYVYAALGVTQIGNAGALFGKEIGVVVKPDPNNKEGENYTRVDHVVFADGRPLVVNGQLQPFSANPNGTFQGGGQQQQGNQGGGFQTGGQQQQGGFQTGQIQNPNGQQQTQQQGQQGQQGGGFQSGAQVQQTQQFNGGGQQFDPNQNGGQQQQGGQYGGSPGGYQQQGQQGGQGGDKPSWS